MAHSRVNRIAARFYLWLPDHVTRLRLVLPVLMFGGGAVGAAVATILGRDGWPGFGAGVATTGLAVAAVMIYVLGVVLVDRLRGVPLQQVATAKRG